MNKNLLLNSENILYTNDEHRDSMTSDISISNNIIKINKDLDYIFNHFDKDLLEEENLELEKKSICCCGCTNCCIL